MEANANVAPDLELVLDAIYDGGVGNVQTDNPTWSAQGRQ
jgi:hypothetical protein